MKKLLPILCLTVILLSSQSALADDELDGLSDASTETSLEESADDLGEAIQEEESGAGEGSTFSISFGGYLKGVAYWNSESYSDELWSKKYGSLARQGKPIPAKQKMSGYNNIGSRVQLKLEGFVGDNARLFTAVNINVNSANSLHDPSNDSRNNQSGVARVVESFVELYEGSRTWKIGSQLLTWGFLEGIEVPTDRVNARDYSYKSTEYEDTKMASTGILLTQSVGDSRLELLYIPIAKTNRGLEFSDYFYPEADEAIEQRPNNGKWASRFTSSVGKLDYSISYVEGIDPEPDLIPVKPITLPPQQGGITYLPETGRRYNRVKSPGLDLQYNFGSWLAKASYVRYNTEDTAGDDLFTKNSWSKYVVGAEFTVLGKMVNLYAGQHTVDNYMDDGFYAQTNMTLGQLRERTDFISGHINADFLPGNALNLIIMAANYWDKTGKVVQSNLRTTVKYKIANGVEILVCPSYMDLMDNVFTDFLTEIKYSF